MGKTSIGWCDWSLNFYTWNCEKISPGCKNCYAATLAERYGKTFNGAPNWRGANAYKELRAAPPGTVVFVNDMSDTYHEGARLSHIHAIHNAAAYLRPDLIFLLLTKRPERALALSPYLAYPPNLWVGTSVESAEYLWRLDYLLEIPAAGHFLSAEPLLGSLAGNPKASDKRDARGLAYYLSIDMKAGFLLPTHQRRYAFGEARDVKYARLRKHHLKWVIVGGESGANRRPFNADWAREIRDLCVEAGVHFFYKQGSDRAPGRDRLLDGREWNQSPFRPEVRLENGAAQAIPARLYNRPDAPTALQRDPNLASNPDELRALAQLPLF